MSKLGLVSLFACALAGGCRNHSGSAKRDHTGAGSPTAAAGSGRAAPGAAAAAATGPAATAANTVQAQAAAGKRPVATEADRAALNAKGMAFIEKVAAAGKANKSDCGKVGAAWNKLIDDHADLLAKMNKLSADETPAQRRAFDAKYKDRLQAVMGVFMPIIKKCEDNKAVQDAVKKLSM